MYLPSLRFSESGSGKMCIRDSPCLENVNQDLLDKFSNWDGVVYGFPIAGAQYWGIYYNKQIFSDLNLEIPKTFEDLETACQKIKDQEMCIRDRA